MIFRRITALIASVLSVLSLSVPASALGFLFDDGGVRSDRADYFLYALCILAGAVLIGLFIYVLIRRRK